MASEQSSDCSEAQLMALVDKAAEIAAYRHSALNVITFSVDQLVLCFLVQ
jgi:hypothetical protein